MALVTNDRQLEASAVKFEVKELIETTTEQGEKLVTRRYDAIINGAKHEMKCWREWQGWSDNIIRNQFVNDLSNQTLDNLEDLQWVFKKTAGITDDVLKNKVIGALKKDIPKLKEALNFNTVKKLFPGDELIDETNYTERLIKNFEKAENFNKVFKVVE